MFEEFWLSVTRSYSSVQLLDMMYQLGIQLEDEPCPDMILSKMRKKTIVFSLHLRWKNPNLTRRHKGRTIYMSHFRVSFANRFFLYLLLFAPHWALHIRVNPPGFLLVRSSSSHHNDHISLSKITLLLPYHYQTLERFLCANRSTWKAGVSDNQVSYRGLHLRVGCARLDVHTAQPDRVQGISPANLAYVASPKIWRGWYVHMQRLRSFEQQLTTLRLYPTYVCLCLLI